MSAPSQFKEGGEDRKHSLNSDFVQYNEWKVNILSLSRHVKHTFGPDARIRMSLFLCRSLTRQKIMATVAAATQIIR